jgi:hypothetical protein
MFFFNVLYMFLSTCNAWDAPNTWAFRPKAGYQRMLSWKKQGTTKVAAAIMLM